MPRLIPNNRDLIAFCLILLHLGACSTTGSINADAEPDTDNKKTLAALIAEGDDAVANNDFDTAQVKYALAVNEDPGNVDALFRLGYIHYQQKSFSVSRDILRKVLTKDDKHAGALETLGLIHLHKKELDLAEDNFKKALQHDENRWQSLNGLGVANDMRSKHLQAQAFFDQALRKLPGGTVHEARVQNNMGYSYYLAGDYARSASHFINATHLAPDYKLAWSNLALSFARQGRYEDARAAFTKIVQPHVAANNLGYLAMLFGNNTLAANEFETALHTAPTHYQLANENLTSLYTGPDEQYTGAGLRELADQKSEDMEFIVVPAVARTDTAKTYPTTDKPAVQKLEATMTSGSEVDAIEQLRFLGYSVDSAQPLTSEENAQIVRDFQIAQRLDADGVLGKGTQRILHRMVIERAQLMLSSFGYVSADAINGELTEATELAIKAYQRDQSIEVNGKLTDGLLKHLIGNL